MLNMNVDAIYARLLDDARREAQRIEADAEAQISDLRARSSARMASAQERALSQMECEAAMQRKLMLDRAEMDMRSARLRAGRRVLDEAFDRALERMCAMDTVSAREFAMRLMLENATGRESIVFDAGYERVYTPGFVASVNAALVKAGRPGELKLDGERRAIGGGFILRQGGVETVCTYAAIVARARLALEGDVARLLFPGR